LGQRVVSDANAAVEALQQLQQAPVSGQLLHLAVVGRDGTAGG
jgi:hypothetical protein